MQQPYQIVFQKRILLQKGAKILFTVYHNNNKNATLTAKEKRILYGIRNSFFHW